MYVINYLHYYAHKLGLKLYCKDKCTYFGLNSLLIVVSCHLLTEE